MNLRRFPLYLRMGLRALVKHGPRNYLKLLSGSPYTVKDLPRYGVALVVDVRDPAISKPILALGEYESNVTNLLLSKTTEDTHFLDIGANLGFFSVVVGKRACRGKVWSIEPDPENYRLLRTNIALNGLQSIVQPRHGAASDREESLFFSTLGYTHQIGARFTAKEKETLLERSLPGAVEPVHVRADCMDHALDGERVDLVKVDVEGFEPAVFKGMHNILKTQKPLVITEFAPGTIRHISKSDPSDMLRFILQLDYSIAIIETDGTIRDFCDEPGPILARAEAGGTHHVDLFLKPKAVSTV